MDTQMIKNLTSNFEVVSNKSDEGIEFWYARDLQHLLGYKEWRNFQNTILKAKTACEISGFKIDEHFVEVNKTIEMPNNAQKEIEDIMLTRYACYLIAQNGDPKKEQIAFAQTYFALQTRKAELIEERMLESERVQARQKLKYTESELSKLIYEQTGGNNNFGLIRSKGDQALFNHTTAQMKKKYDIKSSKPLADFMPTILLKAKDFATEITIHNTRENKFKNENQISNEHITNNKTVRKTLISRGIVPENLSPMEDVSKIERKLKSEDKKLLNDMGKLK